MDPAKGELEKTTPNGDFFFSLLHYLFAWR